MKKTSGLFERLLSLIETRRFRLKELKQQQLETQAKSKFRTKVQIKQDVPSLE